MNVTQLTTVTHSSPKIVLNMYTRFYTHQLVTSLPRSWQGGDYGEADTRSGAQLQLNRDPIVAQFTAALPSRVLGTQTRTMCAVCPAFIMSTEWGDGDEA